MSITIDGCVDVLEYIRDYNDQDSRESWEEMVSSMNEVSAAMYELFQAVGYDGHAIVEILNDEDTDLVLYASMDGELIYDILDDIDGEK